MCWCAVKKLLTHSLSPLLDSREFSEIRGSMPTGLCDLDLGAPGETPGDTGLRDVDLCTLGDDGLASGSSWSLLWKNGLLCADVPLRNYSLTHSLHRFMRI